MARTKAYDKDKALEDAMTLFWAQGYTATSVQQLLDVMSISRSSMYSEFGNKRDLFVEVLSLYFSLTNELIDAISRANDPAEAIRKFYEIGFVQQSDTLLYRGCLLVNTILELRDVDNELSLIAAQYFDEVEKALVNCFQKCASSGTLHPRHDPEILASFFVTVIKGMRVVARQIPSEDYLRGVIETALTVFSGSRENNDEQVV
ncbi:MAG: TetR/AcrR family transcriptional regulator [Desulfobacterales bacterium]|nr:TetR/AcrR family transcriptional regulator [Desulfobacterales bacterium]